MLDLLLKQQKSYNYSGNNITLTKIVTSQFFYKRVSKVVKSVAVDQRERFHK